MSSPRIPDFELLWHTDDDETAAEWLRLADLYTGGVFLEPGEHDHDPAQVVFLLYLYKWVRNGQPNWLFFEAHEDALRDALERFSVPFGGSGQPRYPFWRLQRHRFWQLMSWGECCERCDVPSEVRGKAESEGPVGVLDERAWLAARIDDHLRHNVLTLLIPTYWPNHIDEVKDYFGAHSRPHIPTLNGAPSAHASAAGLSDDARPTPEFEVDSTYPTSVLRDAFNLFAPPLQSIAAPLDRDTEALFLEEGRRRVRYRQADDGRDEIRFRLPNRDCSEGLVLETLRDAQRLLVFTTASEGRSFCHRGVFELASARRRKWSFFRNTHDVVLRRLEDDGAS
jgi:hypothetical protein